MGEGVAEAWGKSQQEGVVKEVGEGEPIFGHPRVEKLSHLVTPPPPEPCEVSTSSLFLLRRKLKLRENKKHNKGEEAGEWKCWDLNPEAIYSCQSNHSLSPHGLTPTRPCSWGFSGKNTEMAALFLQGSSHLPNPGFNVSLGILYCRCGSYHCRL